jgi:hypothetical protein
VASARGGSDRELTPSAKPDTAALSSSDPGWDSNMEQEKDSREQRALEALAIVAEAITEPRTRDRLNKDLRSTLSDVLAREKRDVDDLPEEVLEFFANLSEEELETLAKLQTTMTGLRGKGFASLSDEVEVNPLFTLAKL